MVHIIFPRTGGRWREIQVWLVGLDWFIWLKKNIHLSEVVLPVQKKKKKKMMTMVVVLHIDIDVCVYLMSLWNNLGQQ